MTKTLALRHYLLLISQAEHRKVLTRFLTASHPLAVERLIWPDRYRLSVPRQHRLCRLCKLHIETPEHAAFECNGLQELSQLRSAFLHKIYSEIPSFPRYHPGRDAADYFRKMVDQRPTIALFARFLFDALALFQTVPMWFPPEYIRPEPNTRLAVRAARR